MKYSISVQKSFSSAHALRGYKGKCENLHGHNWKVEAVLSGSKLEPSGMLIDFTVVKGMLGKILEKLDHKYLNRIKPFDKINPSAENIAGYIYKEMSLQVKKHVNKVKVSSIKVWESDTSYATASA